MWECIQGFKNLSSVIEHRWLQTSALQGGLPWILSVPRSCLRWMKSKVIINRRWKPVMLSLQNPIQMEHNSWLISSWLTIWPTGHSEGNKSDSAIPTSCTVLVCFWVNFKIKEYIYKIYACEYQSQFLSCTRCSAGPWPVLIWGWHWWYSQWNFCNTCIPYGHWFVPPSLLQNWLPANDLGKAEGDNPRM